MNILIIAYYAHPDINGGVKRPAAFAKGLGELGHDVTILTHGRTVDGEKKNIYRILDVYDQIGFSGKVKIFINKVARRARLLLGIADTYYSDWKNEAIKQSDEIYKKAKPDLIIASYPPVECLEIGMHFSTKYKVRLFADLRDPLVDESAEKYLIEKHPHMLNFFDSIEQAIISASEKILVIAPSMKDYYETKHQLKNIILLPNGYDSKPTPVKNATFHNEKFIIGYTGTISHYDPDRDLSEFFTALREGVNSEPNIFSRIEVRLYGNINRSDLGKNTDLLDEGHVKIMGTVSMEESVRLQSEFDALLIITGISRKCVATGKIFEYLVSGRPIIALTKNTFAEQIVNSTSTGVCISPRDKFGIYNLLKEAVTEGGISCNPDFEEIKKYSRENQIKVLNEIILK